MSLYNMTNVTLANNWYEVTKAANDLSGGLWVIVLYFLIFFVTYMLYDGKSSSVAVTTLASFMCSFVGILLYGLGWIGMDLMAAPIALFVISLVALLVSRD